MAKIIFLTEEIIKAGGIVRVVNMWANYFAKKGDDIRIIAGTIENPYYKFNDKVKLMQWNFAFQKKIVGIPYNIFQTYILLKSLRKEKDLNLIIDRAIHIEPIWILKKLGLFKNINLIYFAHGGSSDFRDFYLSRKGTAHRVKMIFEGFDKVICLYDDEKYYPTQINRKKLHFVANPLPFEPTNITYKDKENIVLSLGRVTKAKGIDTLIYAWQKVEKDVNDWKLQIVGDGEDKELFINLSKKLALNNISFIDSTTKIKQYYEKSKIFVIPSIAEGMPMTILESMACKSCVISSKTSGGKKLVQDKQTGLLFDINNIDKLSNDILFLIHNKDKREKYANKAFNYIKYYKIEDISKSWNNIIDK